VRDPADAHPRDVQKFLSAGDTLAVQRAAIGKGWRGLMLLLRGEIALVL